MTSAAGTFGVGGERMTMLGLLALAALGCLLGFAAPAAAGPHSGVGEQLLDLLRVLGTVALAVSLLLGPGIAWRVLSQRERPIGLGLLPLPGLLAMVAVGAIAWGLADRVDPRLVCFALLAPLLGLLFGMLLFAGPEEIFDSAERRCLLVVGCVLGLAVARALWSLGPNGELYAGSISRTLEVGDRSDSRISFILPQMVAHGSAPYGPFASELFAPYNFSSRGPLPGLGSAPVVLMSGGHPPEAFPEQPWAPFDHEGFMAYRLAMMSFAATAFVSLWDLVRRIAGTGAAHLAVVLAATTPFLVHEVWFTWPKMLAASLVLMAAICLITERPLAAGLLAGLGYLMHPVALLSLPALGLIALWPLRGARWNRPRIGTALQLVAGLAVFLIAWRLLNGENYNQDTFFEYFRQAGFDLHPSLGGWISYRVESLGNTLVPLLLLGTSTTNPSINIVGGISPPAIHFFFQYWTTLPFGVAIVFFPLLLWSLWKALRLWPWPVSATVLIPFALFALYWGASSTGMLREGLLAWLLTLIAVVACQQAASGFAWLRSTPIRALLSLRAAEVLIVVVGPTLATVHHFINRDLWLTDSVALAAFLALCAALGWLVWTMTPTRLAADPPSEKDLHLNSAVDA